MKKILTLALCLALAGCIFAQENPNAALEKKAHEWVASLNLADAEKAQRVAAVVAAHLAAVRDFHNAHPYTEIPEGINPINGGKLSKVQRQLIISSTISPEVHASLMAGLRKDLTEEQVEQILDKYTVGKVAFTLKAYREIVPNMTAEVEAQILAYLKQAREEAVDYKSMELISGIFEIYKTKCELHLYQNGYNWKKIYKEYVDGLKKKK
jgi:hypothetical protein